MDMCTFIVEWLVVNKTFFEQDQLIVAKTGRPLH